MGYISFREGIHPSIIHPSLRWMDIATFWIFFTQILPLMLRGSRTSEAMWPARIRPFQNAKHATCFTGPHRSVGFSPLFIRLIEKNTGIYISLFKKHVLTWPHLSYNLPVCPMYDKPQSSKYLLGRCLGGLGFSQRRSFGLEGLRIHLHALVHWILQLF